MNINALTYKPLTTNTYKMKSSLSIKKLYKFFEMYGRGRNEKALHLRTFQDSLSAVTRGCGLRVMEDAEGNLLAGYTYKMRKNKLEEKSMYIDGLARNLSEDKKEITKGIMTSVYEDIKQLAQKKKAREITLFVYAGERGLKKNYQRLGFYEDPKCNINKVYLMRVRTKDFINNLYFKCRKYKEALNIKSIIQQLTK
ncbi:TPA: hypothetical protein IAC10_11780 [Candidatus Scatousia excrementigallinarum]|uniref:Uncharacterized protein n=1 Tax=Candidatus Scatousia excrementigallinarum TaxID=2840935 RepID=A0A9D1F0P3_9BACT|nr:hypothetical protein [Candidatus Scatousia excrementigallinarum]